MIDAGHRIGLAIFATHPIQYQVPWFRALAVDSGLDVQVYYAILPDASQQGEGFGFEFEWDLSLLDGYRWQLLENSSATPSLVGFRGCDVRNLVSTLRRHRPDVALITGWNSLYLVQALWACRRLGIPTLVRGDSNVLAPRGLLKRVLQRLLIRRFCAFLAVGQLNRQLYERAGIAPDRIFFCPHFVDIERFSSQADHLSSQRGALRRRWEIPDKAVCFLFVGKLVAKKRVMDFLRAVTDAADSNPSICGLVVGAGEQMNEAQEFVGVHQSPIRFTGFLNQNEIAAAYVAADCLVLPSDHGETWGLVVNEAMACGRPAIVSDQVGCGPDLVIDGQTGAVYPLSDIQILVALMNRYGSDQSLLLTMGSTARRHTESRYTVAGAVSGVINAAVSSLRN